MTVKAITFLGLGPYHEAAYVYKEKKYITSLFPLALAEFCDPQPEQWIVCVTKESKKTEYFKTLEAQLNAEPFLISWGEDDEQLWEIFNALVELVEPGDQVVFDITHGLRSLPLIVFLASTYLPKFRPK